MATDAFVVPYPLRDYSATKALGMIMTSPLQRVAGAAGTGYLAGTYPGGATTIDNVPVAATVRVLIRGAAGAPGDGAFVAEVASAADGTWRVDGLPLRFKYDVVGRHATYNDVIMTNVTPATS